MEFGYRNTQFTKQQAVIYPELFISMKEFRREKRRMQREKERKLREARRPKRRSRYRTLEVVPPETVQRILSTMREERIQNNRSRAERMAIRLARREVPVETETIVEEEIVENIPVVEQQPEETAVIRDSETGFVLRIPIEELNEVTMLSPAKIVEKTNEI